MSASVLSAFPAGICPQREVFSSIFTELEFSLGDIRNYHVLLMLLLRQRSNGVVKGISLLLMYDW
jgi:hypothetical protein